MVNPVDSSSAHPGRCPACRNPADFVPVVAFLGELAAWLLPGLSSFDGVPLSATLVADIVYAYGVAEQQAVYGVRGLSKTLKCTALYLLMQQQQQSAVVGGHEAVCFVGAVVGTLTGPARPQRRERERERGRERERERERETRERTGEGRGRGLLQHMLCNLTLPACLQGTLTESIELPDADSCAQACYALAEPYLTCPNGLTYATYPNPPGTGCPDLECARCDQLPVTALLSLMGPALCSTAAAAACSAACLKHIPPECCQSGGSGGSGGSMPGPGRSPTCLVEV